MARKTYSHRPEIDLRTEVKRDALDKLMVEPAELAGRAGELRGVLGAFYLVVLHWSGSAGYARGVAVVIVPLPDGVGPR